VVVEEVRLQQLAVQAVAGIMLAQGPQARQTKVTLEVLVVVQTMISPLLAVEVQEGLEELQHPARQMEETAVLV
jgi:hypothetical protein